MSQVLHIRLTAASGGVLLKGQTPELSDYTGNHYSTLPGTTGTFILRLKSRNRNKVNGLKSDLFQKLEHGSRVDLKLHILFTAHPTHFYELPHPLNVSSEPKTWSQTDS